MLLVAVFYLFCVEFGYSKLIEKPHDSVVLVNGSTRFNCSSDSKNISWQHFLAIKDDPTDNDDYDVFIFGRISPRYADRFRVEPGTFNLLLSSVRPGDAGKYVCKDNEGLSLENAEAQLYVLDCMSNTVDGIIGPNSCGIDSEDIVLSCSLIFLSSDYHRDQPVMLWRKIGNSETIKCSSSLQSEKHLTCNLTMNSDLHFNGSIYVCEVVISSEFQNKWTSPVVKIKYALNSSSEFNNTVGNKVLCLASSSHPCNYTWKFEDGKEKNGQWSTNQMVLDRAGVYKCEAECILKDNQYCKVSVMQVLVTESYAGESSYLAIIVVLLVIIIIIIILVICVATIIIILIRRRREKSRAKMTDASASEKCVLNHNSTQETKDGVSETEFLLQKGNFQEEPKCAKDVVIPNNLKVTYTRKRNFILLDTKLDDENSDNQSTQQVETEQNKENRSNEKQSAQEQSPVIEKAKQTTAGQSSGKEECPGKEQSPEKEKQVTGKENVNEQPTVVKQGTEIKRLNEKEPTIEKKQVDKVDVSSMSRPDAHQEKFKQYEENPALITTISTAAARKQKKGISGLAISNNELFISSFQWPDIEVFDSNQLVFSRQFTLDKLINPFFLAFCKRNGCLYILDITYGDYVNKIMRVDPEGTLINEWSTTDLSYGSLSVSEEGNVILVAQDENTINEYTPEGRHVREIKLSTVAGFLHPRHAIKLDTSHILVSHGEGNDPLHRLCIVDGNGDIRVSFGGQRGSLRKELDTPIYITLNKDRSVFVVDRDNSRVVLGLLDSSLEFMSEIIPHCQDGLQRPERLVVDESNGRLLIAHNDVQWAECRVFIFQIA